MADRFLTDAEQLAIAALHAVVSEDVAEMTPEEREAAMAPIKVEIRRRIKARAEEPREPRELCSMTADLTVDPMIEKLRSERDVLRARCGELEANVDELRVDRNTLEAQGNALRARCGELESAVDAARDNRDKVIADCRAFMSEIARILGESVSADESLERANNRTLSRVTALRNSRDRLTVSRDRLIARVNELEHDISAEHDRYQDLCDERDQARDHARCLEECDLIPLRSAHARLAKERDALAARVQELEVAILSQSAAPAPAYHTALEGLRAERDALAARVDELRRSEELLRNDLLALAEERDVLRARVEELTESSTRFQEMVRAHRIQASEMMATIRELRGHLSPPVDAPDGRAPDGRPLTATDLRRRFGYLDEAGAPCDGGGNVPTYRERPRPGNVKPRPDLLPAEALLAAGECLADRTDRDVGSLPWFDRAPLAETLPKYRASLMRHVLAYYADDKVDPESSRPALAHVIVNASILYRLENRAITARQGTES